MVAKFALGEEYEEDHGVTGNARGRGWRLDLKTADGADER
jgi:hypothetical protein